jgi:hypothetical protein
MYQYSEPTQDYTAPAVGVFAALVEHYGTQKFEPFSDCTLDLGWDAPGHMAGATKRPRPVYPIDDCYHTCNTGCGSQSSVFDKESDASSLVVNSLLGLLVVLVVL